MYTHIEKTAGSAFVVGARQILGEDHIYDLRGGNPRPMDMSPAELQKIRLFSGHFWYDTQERPIGRRKKYFMSIRDPVDRFVSYYDYVAAAPSHPGYNKYGTLPVEEAFAYLQKHNPNALYNRFCAMFGDRAPAKPGQPGKPVRRREPVTFEQARAKIDLHYALVIPMRRMNDALLRLAEVFGAPPPATEPVNVAVKPKKTQLPDSIRRSLIEGNKEDYNLLKYCEAAFDENAKNLVARLTRMPEPPEGRAPGGGQLGNRLAGARPLGGLMGKMFR